MLKKAIVLILAAASITGLAFAAPDRVGLWDAGINASGLIHEDSEVDNTVYVGGTFAYGVHQWIALGVEAGWFQTDSEEDTFSGIGNLGELTANPLMADIIIRVPNPDQPFIPYAIIGIGVVFYDFDESESLEGLGVDVDVDTAFALKVGGGIDWWLNANWIANFEASYVFNDADINLTAGGSTASDEADLDYFQIGGGLKYLFG
ncbi:MAG: outer membrane beta-barrel protein [Methylococcales bacterium]